jgi:hypothetical protein
VIIFIGRINMLKILVSVVLTTYILGRKREAIVIHYTGSSFNAAISNPHYTPSNYWADRTLKNPKPLSAHNL